MPMPSVEELLASLQAILDAASAEGRAATDEELDRAAEIEAQIKAINDTDQLQKRAAAYNSPAPTPLVKTAVRDDRSDEDRAFEHYLRTGQVNSDLTEYRAQSVGTDGAGGFLVPDLMRDKIIDRLKAFGGLAGAVEEITTSGGETLRWPVLDDTANTGVIAAEGTAPGSAGADLVFTEKTLGAFKYVAPGASQLPLRVSVELLQDSAFDIQALVQRKLGERIGRAQAPHWVTGNGTTEPFGIDTGTAATAFTSAGITYAELVGAVHSVDPAYRMNAKWSFNDATAALIESIVDSTGRPILNDANAGIASGPDNQKLLGYPVVIDQAWPTYTDGGTTRWGVFGDLQAGYVIRRVKDLTLIVNPYTRANEGQVEYVLWARADGTVQDTGAYRVLINAV